VERIGERGLRAAVEPAQRLEDALENRRGLAAAGRLARDSFRDGGDYALSGDRCTGDR